jgi:hypothetical protein
MSSDATRLYVVRTLGSSLRVAWPLSRVVGTGEFYAARAQATSASAPALEAPPPAEEMAARIHM